MFNVIWILLACSFFIPELNSTKSEERMRPVDKVQWENENFAEKLVNHHLTKLTSEIYRDAFIKMKTVRSNGQVFEKQSSFAIGVIASNIYSLFDKMVKIYQEVSALKKIRELETSILTGINDTTLAFGAIQSLYHQIRLEKKLFQNLLIVQAREYDNKQKEYELAYGKLPVGGSARPDAPKGGMAFWRRTNAEDLFDEDNFDSNFELPLLSKRNTKQSKDFQQIGKMIVDQKPTAKKHLPLNSYAPPPPNARQSDHYHMQKPADPFAFLTPGVSKILPPGFPKPPSNSSILKIMAQLNKDSPSLNPDFNAFLRGNRRGNKAMSDGNDAYELPKAGSNSYPVQLRRSGSSSYSITKLPIMGSYSHPDIQKQRRSNSYSTVSQQRLGSDRYAPTQKPRFNSYSTIVQPKLGSYSYAPARKSRRSKSYHEIVQPRLDSDRYDPAQPPGYDSYRIGYDTYAPAQKPRGRTSYRAIEHEELTERDPNIQLPISGDGSHSLVQAPRMQHSGVGAPHGSRAFNNRGRFTTTIRSTKLRWKPNKQH